MNTPTIAAVVHDLKPPAGRSSGPDASNADQSPNFNDTLAEQSVDLEAHTGTPSSATPSIEKAEARSAQAHDDAKDIDEPPVWGSSLAQATLEIAHHALQHRLEGKARVDNAAALNSDKARTGPIEKLAQRIATSQTSHHAQSPDGKRDTHGEGARHLLTPELNSEPMAAAVTAASGPNTREAAAPSRSGSWNRLTTGLAADAQHVLKQTLASTINPGTRLNAQIAQPGSGFSATENFNGLAQAHMQEQAHGSGPHGVPGDSAMNAAVGLVATGAPAFAPHLSATTGLAITTPVHQHGWDADFGRQVVTLLSNAHTGRQTAELRLDPPELGPLRISLNLNEGLASALFVSAHASVRHAIEAALPQLSQQLSEAGISLSDTHVGEDGQHEWAFTQQANKSFAQSGQSGGMHAASDETASPARSTVSSTALVDTFA